MTFCAHILNLTQHAATAEQLEAGVIEPPPYLKESIKALLTFEDIPSAKEITRRADCLAELAADFDEASQYKAGRGVAVAMIGGAPFLMPSLDKALRGVPLLPVYAFSRRESSEVDDGNGGVRKVAVFRHLGFVGVTE